MKKRMIAILICLSLIINVLPLSIFAEKLNQPDQTNTKTDIKIFKDVNEKDWFYDAAMYAMENGIFSGDGDGNFSAKGSMTRGMYVTILGRIAKVENNKVIKEKLFSDIESDAYYAPYVNWAAEMGITKGIGGNKFGPDILINREQMATFTVRFFDAYDIEYPKTTLKEVPADFEKIDDYAKSSVLKLWNAGLLEGDQNGYFNPKKDANRAEGATFAVRIHKGIQEFEKKLKEESEKLKANDKDLKENTKPKIEDPKQEEDDDDDVVVPRYYNIKYNSNGGSKIETQSVSRGYSLKNLPTPYKQNEIFVGWYYDLELENRVSSKDAVGKDLNLYAKYSSVAPLAEAETPSFASAMDQGTDFSIQVVASKDMTNEEVKDSVNCKNLSSKEKSNIIQVTGNGRIFNISGKNGFEAGATYKLTLEDENLSFQGHETSVRNYNFTIFKEEVFNLKLNQNIIYIPFEQVSNITQDGKDVKIVTTTLARISSDSNSTLSDLTKGTFIYDGTLNIGDSITLYEGIRPDQRMLKDNREGSDGEIAYLEITAVNGNMYSYKNSEMEDVLFKPDVLPISNTSDTDGDPLNNSITVDKTVLEFSDDIYTPMQLDSQTTVDIGDYLAFYEGEFGINTNVVEYGCITSIKDENGKTIISYADATMDEIISAMDMYSTESVDGDALLEDEDVKALERDVEKQAKNSGFADEAAMYLADLALQTDSFTKLSDDFKMTDFQLSTQDGKSINPEEVRLMASGSKVEVSLSKLKATISTKLKHFDVSGVRLTLEVGVEITIEVSEDIEIVITVTGYFEEEINVSINVDGGATWKWWGPFPYIAEYEATANIEFYNFTGLGVHATIVTKEKKDNKWTEDKGLQNISEELKKLLDAKDKYIGDGEGTVADGLTEKYQAMLENESDWVNLFEKEMFSTKIKIPPALGILVIEISGNFLISVNMNISLGCDFYYENAKRYVYTVQVFAKNVISDVIDIREEHYEFTFYVMGTLGIRAGIKLEIAVGIISTKLGSVGFTAEFGVYARVWGYFYYQLEYTASKGRSSSYSGALLFELGIYLEIFFVAQAFAETFTYELELYAEEWPLWSAGMRQNVRDFAYSEGEEFTMKKYIRELTVPDEVFNMTYMDLKTGDVEDKVYDDAKDFNIEIVNNAFAYEPITNILSVNPDKGDFIEEGQMIVTWGGAPLAFTSAPISRSFDLYWDNLNNGYTIMFNSNGGSSIPMILNRYNVPIVKPNQPTKKGYDFAGWYADEDFKSQYIIPELMPNTDNIVYAKWIPRNDTEYKVEHYKQNDKNTLYTIVETDTQILYGTTDSIIEPKRNIYEGFNTPESQELKILPDGSGIIKYYYSRGSYTVSFDTGEIGSEPTIYKYKYEKAISVPQISKMGYTFKSWDKEVPQTMPANNISFVAQWSEAEDIPYRVEHYVQNTNGNGYALTQIERKSGNTNQEINIIDIATVGEGIAFERSTVDGINTETTKIKSDGSLVAKLYYTRNQYKISYVVENGNNSEKTYRYGEVILQPITPVKDGYTFLGWKSNESLTKEFVFGKTMPSENITVYGVLKPNTDTKFIVEHYYQNTIGDGYSLNQMNSKEGTTDEEIELSNLATNIDGITLKESMVDGIITEKTNIKGDGTLVVKIYYTRNKYKINYVVENGNNIEKTYRFGEIVEQPAAPVKAGYTFSGWKSNESLTESFEFGKTMPSENITVYGEFKPKKDTEYIVEHYKQNVSGEGYTRDSVDNLTGTTDTESTAVAKSYIGFTAKQFNQSIISGDVKTVIRIEYDRNSYNVNLDPAGGIINKGNIMEYTYGIDTPLPTDISHAGYSFDGWFEGKSKVVSISETENGDKSYLAKWSPENNISYKVRHLREDLYGQYTIEEIETKYGTTDTETVASARDYTGFTVSSFSQDNISGDRSTVVEIRYSRNSYILSWNIIEGSLSGSYTSGNIKFGETIIQPNMNKEGYTFLGWHSDSSLLNKYTIPSSMPAQDIHVFGTLTANSGVSYKVIHYLQNANDNGYTAYETENLNGYTDEEVSSSPKTYNYFNFNENAGGTLLSGNIKADGSLVLKLYYDREMFTVNYMVDGEVYGMEERYKYEQTVDYPTSPSKEGYFFDTWQLDEYAFAGTMPGKDIILTSGWSAGEKSYTIRYFIEKLIYTNESNKWELLSRDSIVESGTFDDDITVEPRKDYIGFKTPGEQEIKLNSNLSTVDFYYTRNSFILNWILNDGIPNNDYTQSGEVKFKTSVIAPTLTMIGHSYTWDKVIEETMPDRELEYTANWVANSYVVRFNEEDLENIEVIYGGTYGQLPVPSKVGHTFDGWYTNPISGEMITEDSLVTITANQVLYANWTAERYTLTWDLDGGTALTGYTTGNIPYGTTIVAPVPVKIGHDFIGWDAEVNSTIPDQNLTYKANWTPKSYTVTLNVNGGTIDKPSVQVTYDEKYGELPVPSKVGHTFDGWYTNPINGEKITENSLVIITTDQIIYAHWSAEVYTLTWDLDGGTASNEYTNGNVAYGTNIIQPNPNRAGYTFTSWDDVVNSTMPAENLTYKANWAPKAYNVTLNPNGGTIKIGGVTKYTYGVGAVLPTDVTREGYIFNGWYDGETKVESILETSIGNKDYIAKWLANSYSITYFNMDGAVNHGSNISSYTFGKGLFLGAPSKIGYEFQGWYKEESLNNKVTSITTSDLGNIDLYAKWTVKVYQVTLNTDGGNLAVGDSITSYTYGEAKILPTNDKIIKKGYTFNGWYDGTKIVTEISLGSTGAKSYTATWSIVNYTIYYELNSGINSLDNPGGYNITSGDIILADPSKAAHIFGGWFTDSNFTTPAGSPAIVGGRTENIYFYAKWIPMSYSVVFIANEGTGTMSPQMFNVGESKDLSLNSYTRAGYNFVGWSKTSSGSKQYDNGSRVSNLSEVNGGIVNLYAVWTPITYTITYNLYGGINGANPGTYTILTQGIILKAPTRDRYSFQGWYNNSSFTGSKVVQIDAGSIGNMSLYANWKAKLDISGVNSGVQTFIYNGSAQTFVIKDTSITGFTVKYKKTGDVNWSNQAVDAGTYSVQITRPTDETYNAYSSEWSNALVINRAARTMSAPKSGSGKESTILIPALTDFTGYGHGDVEYAVSTTITAPTSGWTTSLSVPAGNTMSANSYYLFARVTEGGNFLAATSGATSFTVSVNQLVVTNYRNWDIRIKTGTSSGAGTDAAVGVRFNYIHSGYSARYIMDKPNFDDHENGDDVVYSVTENNDPWMLSGFEIGNDGAKAGSNWQCAFVELKTGNAGPFSTDINSWFDNRYQLYNMTGFKRSITSTGQFNSWGGSYNISTDHTGFIDYSFNGNITDQYGTYNAYAHYDAPSISVVTSQGGYTDCFSYNLNSFKVDKNALYNKMVKNNLNSLTFTINLNFDSRSSNTSVYTKTVTITR